ncbi:MAG: MotA/TolQ/ExbB proton channel family protein [Candidatus Muirbacterium halophilum]|nr:MotA/TolQ/ExbB proton channel family protein [Candidatus Muirbacterium halophilum]MCK9475902.1 MotA/TolQ/ExbB proton channel family protein [Candidatus Muirbacterium halophilum]
MNEFIKSTLITMKDGGIIALFIGIICFFICFISLKIFFKLKNYVNIPHWLEDKVLLMIQKKVPKIEIIEFTGKYSEFFANILKYVLNDSDKIISGKWIEIYFAEFPYFRDNINFLKALVNAAPLAGLLGTVWGMIRTFSAISTGYSSKLISEGISQALVTTQFGLIAALPGLFAISVLTSKLNQLEIRFRNLEINLRSGVEHEKIK